MPKIAMPDIASHPDKRKFASKSGSGIRALVLACATAGMLGFGLFGPALAQNANLSVKPDSGDIPIFTEKYADAEFCADGTGNGPCAVAPVDVPEFDASFVYRFLAYHAQRPFDRFSWQAFTSLMAPVDDPSQPAIWESFPTRRTLFSEVGYPNSACAKDLPSGHLLLASYVQSSGDILIDQAGNFVLYETRINPVAETYIRENDLQSPVGRKAFAASGQDISFPTGHVFEEIVGKVPSNDTDVGIPPSAPGVMGAQLLKFAWRILPSDGASVNTTSGAYYARPARIAVAGTDSLDGKPACLDVTVGLVGLHLVQRVASGNGDRWIWASFEHVGNVPLAKNARRPNSIITDNLFPDGCLAPDDAGDQFAFYGGKVGAGQEANQSISGPLKWAREEPYARLASGEVASGPDIVRCWRLFSGTAESNFIWQSKLGNSVWANYLLLGTQWIGNPGNAPFGVGEVPRYLTNSALESFMQHQTDASCLSCHDRATTDTGQRSNFTFLLDPLP
ncbi:MAG: hypothetical protein ACMZ66_14945 [Thalassospira sp.]|uniref:hypothetical protein n=1 Tax=Thalassospira sp. TaxID=1912094 RepID=UPI003A8B3254